VAIVYDICRESRQSYVFRLQPFVENDEENEAIENVSFERDTIVYLERRVRGE
jgi:hypothetical protein